MQRGLLMIALVMIAATGFVGFRFADDKTALTVTYEVKCKECNITYRDENGNSAELQGIKDGWEYEFTGKAGQFVYVSATNPDGSETEVLIKRGGKDLIKGKSIDKELAARAGSIL